MYNHSVLDKLFLLLVFLFILLARGGESSRYIFVIILAVIAFAKEGELDFLL